MNTGSRLHSVFASLLVAVAPLSAFAQQGRGESTSATELWSSRCASCHGGNGEGVAGKAKTLLTDAAMEEANDKPFFESLRKAQGPHAGEEIKAMSDRQSWAVIVHLREMQAKDWRKRVGDPKRDKAGVYSSKRASYKVEQVISDGLSTPWSIAWLPPSAGAPTRTLVTEKDGKLKVYQGSKLVGEVGSLPKLVSNGQGGLMDVAPHPEYAANGWVYLAFAEGGTGRNEMTKVVRGKITQTEARDADSATFAFTDQEVIFQPRHYNGAGVHYGSRIVFQKPAGDDAKEANGRWLVYFSIGERGGMEQAQGVDRPNGKMHRCWDDGKIPASNPFAGDANGYPSIWSVGHRNQQGVCFDDQGNLWVTEHGPRGGDELNLITRGGNYGWPQTCFGINYSDQPFVLPWKDKAANGMPITLPVHRWLPSIAACGLDCARAVEVKGTFPDWAGDLFAGGLAGQTVQRLRIKEGKLVEQEEILHGLGRIRDVAFGPDGNLYIVLNGPDKVVRVAPAK